MGKIRKKCPDCDVVMKEVRKVLVDDFLFLGRESTKIIELYPKPIVEPNLSKTYHEYRFVCPQCKTEWIYNSLFRYFGKVPKNVSFLYSWELVLLVKNK